MKKLTLVILITFFTVNGISQETKKVKEVGITFYNFQKYGLQYNVGNGTNMWRFRALNGGISIGYRSNGETLNSRFSVSIGRERRKEIAPSLKFVYGIELSGIHNYHRTTTLNGDKTKSHQFSGGIIGVIGMRYDINERFYANAELLPSAIIHFGANGSTNPTYFGGTNQTFSFGFGNNSALLSVGIKF